MKNILAIGIIVLSINGFAQIPVNGLVAFYPFNGNANDTSGNGHNGTVHGATLTTDRYGNPNSAYYFNGSAYIQVPYSNALNLMADKTISAWTYISTSDNASLPWYPTIINKNTALATYTTYALQLNTYSGYGINQYKYDFFFGDSITNYLCNSVQLYTNLLNQWVCITGSYGNSTGLMKIYINGILNNSYYVGSKTSSNSSMYDLFIGACDMSHCHFVGKIDEVAIYDRALSDLEVTSLCDENTGIKETQAKNDDLIIYPNPSENKITIESPVNAEVQIIDIQGQTIKSISIKDHAPDIDLSDFSRGVYIIRVATDKAIITRRLIKQ